MTVSNEIDRSGPYFGNGVTKAFEYDFKILDKSHLFVIRTEGGVETVLTVDADYTVSGVGSDEGGQITTAVAPTVIPLQTITILRSVPFVQETDLENQGAYYAETVERSFDLSVMRDQQLNERLGRTLMHSVGGSSFDAGGKSITNLGDATGPNDAVNLGQLQPFTDNAAAAVAAAEAARDVAVGQANRSEAGADRSEDEADRSKIEADRAVAVVAGAEGLLVATFVDRDHAIAAELPPTVQTISVRQPSGVILEYRRDDNGTALTTADGAKWSPNGPVYPDHFGENTVPGTTDMSSAAQAAVNWMGHGGVLKYLDAQTYRQNETIVIPFDDFTVDRGTSTIDISTLTQALVDTEPDAAFKVFGATTAATSLAADVAENAMTITVSNAAGLRVGDPVRIMSNAELWYMEESTVVRRHIINRIAGIAGNVIRLAWPATMSFSVSGYTVTVLSWRAAKNFKAIGQGPMYGGGVRGDLANGKGAAAFYLRYADYAEIEVGYLEGFQGYGVKASLAMDVHTYDGLIRGHPEDYTATIVEDRNSGFYGVRYDDGFGGSIRNISGRRTRHLQDATRWASCAILNCQSQRSHRPPFGSHYGCTDFLYIGNRSTNQTSEGAFTGGGIQWRGHTVTAIGNSFDNPNGVNPWFYDVYGSENDIPRTYILIGNSGRTGRSGISLNANIDCCSITDNDIVAGLKDANYSGIEIATKDLGSCRVSGGKIKMANGFHCVQATNSSPRTRANISIENVRLSGYVGARPVRFYSTKNVVYRDNKLDDTTPAHTDGGTGGVQILGPNYAPDGTAIGAQAISWTPILTDGVNAANASTAVGFCTISGSLAHINGRIKLSSLGSASGNLKITGIPKAILSVGNNYEVVSFFATSGNFGAGGRVVVGRISPGASEMALFVSSTSSGFNPLTASEVGGTVDLMFSGTFAIS